MGVLFDIMLEKRSMSSETWLNSIKNYLAGEDTHPVNTAAGVPVNQTAAMGITAVYSAIRLISWTMASLPLVVYKTLKPRGKERALRSSLCD